MTEIINASILIFFGVVAIVVFAVFVSILQQGPTQIRNQRRNGYGVKALIKGHMPKSNEGSTIDIIEGLEFISNEGRVSEVRQTRTISAEKN